MLGNRDYLERELVGVDVVHEKFSNNYKRYKCELVQENSIGPFKIVEKTSKGGYLVELNKYTKNLHNL